MIIHYFNDLIDLFELNLDYLYLVDFVNFQHSIKFASSQILKMIFEVSLYDVLKATPSS
jgi:hypothetical protein